LQERWKKEAGVDVIERVIARLQSVSGMSVRVASEDDREYFAGILRAVDRGIGVHADCAVYVSPDFLKVNQMESSQSIKSGSRLSKVRC
jgi:hypothetical protein